MVNPEQEKKTNGLRIEYEIFREEKFDIYLCVYFFSMFLPFIGRLSLWIFNEHQRARETLSLSNNFHLHPLESLPLCLLTCCLLFHKLLLVSFVFFPLASNGSMKIQRAWLGCFWFDCKKD